MSTSRNNKNAGRLNNNNRSAEELQCAAAARRNLRAMPIHPIFPTCQLPIGGAALRHHFFGRRWMTRCRPAVLNLCANTYSRAPIESHARRRAGDDGLTLNQDH
ncbi:hypothetical protein HL667_13975 [Bradyrhizobium sp. 83012]|uniref:Uncharacterized protein n=1 Tax=Bradyrhizobium aeschynomenes TaxID=2734909 RepID=A0ABX2CD02_9BRAD|nr:hypothetical protein [Bradyrhizobium aeschynomenes]NPU66106.1 hypothetical protein [Bradyrhizobium aeschynomenes]NPV20740.1 hypothetical protein [Bradyrhizobium aeschynomenes]